MLNLNIQKIYNDLNLNVENIYNNLNLKIKVELSDLIYYIAYFLYLTKMVITTTMLNKYLNSLVTIPITLICLFLLLIKIILLNKYSKKSFTIISLLSFLVLVIYINSSYNELIFILLFIIGANNVKFENIVKIFLGVRISILLIAMFAAKVGLIENIIYIREGRVRESFGSIYPTDFAAGVFFIILAYLYIKSKKLRKIDSIIFFILGVGVYYFCDARLDSICILLISAYSFIKVNYNRIKNNDKINRIKSNDKINSIIKFILISSTSICSIFSILTAIIYDNSNKFMNIFNKLLSNRLELAKRGINEYGFTLFGQKVDMIGNGGGMNINPNDYFFIDSSYIFILLRYGTIILIIFCILLTIYMKKTIELGEFTLAVIVMAIAINSIIAHRLLDIAYNPFLLMFLSKINLSTEYRYNEKKAIFKLM